jgi:putative effector of murein hydrolase LrgA (UPF0299 family)
LLFEWGLLFFGQFSQLLLKLLLLLKSHSAKDTQCAPFFLLQWLSLLGWPASVAVLTINVL